MVRVLGMAAASCLVAALAVGCGSSNEGPPPQPSSAEASTLAPGADDELFLTFDDVSATGRVDEARNLGTSPVTVEGRTFTGAKLVLDVGLDGGQAVRFPAVAAPPALVTVTSQGRPDLFSPGSAAFTFGADVKLDPGAAEPDDSQLGGLDNGNNVVQRGLFGDEFQFKIQVDKGRASCRLQGTGGEVLVKADVPVPADTWTRLTCARDGKQVTLVQEILAGADAGQQETWQDESAIGSIEVPADAAPFTIGGKINQNGAPVRDNSDQFNGSIDNVFFALAD